jgi:Tol biopolymer transport system component
VPSQGNQVPVCLDEHRPDERILSGSRSFAFIAGWSPDGKRIGFTLCVQKRQQCDIYTMQRDGTDVVQITNTPEFNEFTDWGPSLVTP